MTVDFAVNVEHDDLTETLGGLLHRDGHVLLNIVLSAIGEIFTSRISRDITHTQTQFGLCVYRTQNHVFLSGLLEQ